MWALDPRVKMPTEEEIKEMPIENTPKEKEEPKPQERKPLKKCSHSGFELSSLDPN